MDAISSRNEEGLMYTKVVYEKGRCVSSCSRYFMEGCLARHLLDNMTRDERRAWVEMWGARQKHLSHDERQTAMQHIRDTVIEEWNFRKSQQTQADAA